MSELCDPKAAERNALFQTMVDYYSAYYRDALGLPGYEQLVASRLREDDTFEEVLSRVRPLVSFFAQPPQGKRLLVVGAGTGREFVHFSRLGYDTYGIEPNPQAMAIIQAKCRLYGLDGTKVLPNSAEQLPFSDGCFDFVWSWTVLEHVTDYRRSLTEIHRIMRPGASAYLAMPDMRQFWEAHYKLPLPMFLPKPLLAVILFALGRPVGFLFTGINRINTRRVRWTLEHLGFDSMQYFPPWPEAWQRRRTFSMAAIYWMTWLTGIHRDQYWILRKP